MSGHSQFKNIMYRKGAQDAKKARVFAKLARDITIAAKSGLPEPDKNPRLRLAIQAARAESMPKDNIERQRLCFGPLRGVWPRQGSGYRRSND